MNAHNNFILPENRPLSKSICMCGHPLFIPLFVAGHPTLESTVTTILNLSEVGADIIELGIPFSDPVADGPVNQNASEIALKNGATLNWCLDQVNQVRLQKCNTPIILFTYLNPILAIGVETFCEKAKTAGVNGVLIVDLPPKRVKIYIQF